MTRFAVNRGKGKAVPVVGTPGTEFVARPDIVPPSGTFPDSLDVSITGAAGATTYYAASEDVAPADPTELSTEYTTPFTLTTDPDTTKIWFVKAKSFETGKFPSAVAGTQYSIYDSTPTLVSGNWETRKMRVTPWDIAD